MKIKIIILRQSNMFLIFGNVVMFENLQNLSLYRIYYK